MKPLLALLAFLAIPASACCQTAIGPEDVIKRMIFSGVSEGWFNKIIGGMGDQAAVLVTKTVADQHLGTAEIDGVLQVLSMAFAGNASESSDRQPRTALFVLQFCDSVTQDAGLKKRIAETREYVQKYAKPENKSR